MRHATKNLTFLIIILFLVSMVIIAGCTSFTRTIYVPDGTPVRLREEVHGVKVWVLGAGGKPVAGVMTLPEGWYCLPMPEEEEVTNESHGQD